MLCLRAILTVGLHGRGFASSPVFYQVIDEYTQKPVSISPLIVTEDEKAHKPGDRSPCYAVACVGLH